MRAALAVFAAALCLGCGPGPLLLLDLQVPADVMPKKVRVYATTGADPGIEVVRTRPSTTIDGDKRKVTVELPRGSTGKVAVTVHVLADDDCVAASGSADITADQGAGPYEIPVALEKRAFRVCDGQGVPLRAAAVTSSGALFAVGEKGTALRWDTTRGWSPLPTGRSENLNGVYAANDNNVWVVGDNGVILRWDGAAFTAEMAGMNMSKLSAVAGASADEVWAVGEQSTILRRINGKWMEGTKIDWGGTMPMPLPTLSAVAAQGSRVLVAGYGGTLLSWGGDSFVRINTGVTEWLRAVAIKQRGAATVDFVVGAAGRFLRVVGPTATKLDSLGDGNQAMNALWMSNSFEGRVVGDGGAAFTCDQGLTGDTPKRCVRFSEGEIAPDKTINGIVGLQNPNDLWLVGANNGVGAKDVLLHFKP